MNQNNTNKWSKCFKSVFLFRIPSYLLFVALLLVVLVVWPIFRYESECDYRLFHMKASLKMTRTWIQEFNTAQNKYPNSVKELRNYIKSEQGEIPFEKVFIDFKGDKQNLIPEFDELNNKGGYYYDNKTGDLKINYTKPIKCYLKFYFGKYRDEIPSEW